MAKKSIYSIFDLQSGYHKNFFPARADGEAIRSFETLVNDEQRNQIKDYPEDFELMFIGEFDDNTGEFTNVQHKKLGRGSQYVKKEALKAYETHIKTAPKMDIPQAELLNTSI